MKALLSKHMPILASQDHLEYSSYVWECRGCGELCEGSFLTGTEPEFTCDCGERYPKQP
jgi:hypothetical protein